MKEQKKMKRIMAMILSLTMILSMTDGFSLSAFAATKLSKPVVKSVKETGNANVTITWKKIKSAKKYQIMRSTKKSGKGAKKLGTVKKTRYIDKSTKDGKTYYYSVKAVNGKKKTSSKWKKFKTSGAPVLGELHSNTGGILENESDDVKFTVSVKNYKRVKNKTISLSYSGDTDIIGYLSDDGKNGDARENDGEYTLETSVKGVAGSGELRFEAKLKKQKSEPVSIFIFDDVISGKESEDYIKTDQEIVAVNKQYTDSDGYVTAENAKKAIDAVYSDAEKLKENGSAVYIEKQPDSVLIQLSSGINFMYTPNVKGVNAGGDDSPSLTMVSYRPFYQYDDYVQDTTSGTSITEDYSYDQFNGTQVTDVVNSVILTLDNVNTGISYAPYSKVDADSITKIASNQVIIWDGHGGFSDKYGESVASGVNTSEYGYVDTKEKKFIVPDNNKYNELISGECVRVIAGNANRIAYTGKYFDKHIQKNLSNTFLYFSSCHTCQDSRFADVFTGRGATVVGFNDSVYTNYGYAVMKELFANMITEDKMTGYYNSVESALKLTTDKLGDTDVKYLNAPKDEDGPASPVIYGNKKYRLSNKNFLVDAAIAAYKKTFENEKKDRYGIGVSFIYLDDDAVPEMVITNGSETGYAMPSVYTYHNGKVVGQDLADYATGSCDISTFRYSERKGYITNTNLIIRDGRVYAQLNNGKFKQLVYLMMDDGTYGGPQIQIGNGKYKTISSSKYYSYVRKYDGKYNSNPKKIKMYDSFDEALKDVDVNDIDIKVAYGPDSLAVADGTYWTIASRSGASTKENPTFSSAYITNDSIVINGGLSGDTGYYNSMSRTIPLASGFSLEYGVDGQTFSLSRKDFNDSFKKLESDGLGFDITIRNGEAIEVITFS